MGQGGMFPEPVSKSVLLVSGEGFISSLGSIAFAGPIMLGGFAHLSSLRCV